MIDFKLIALCEIIVADHAECTALSQSVTGGVPREEDARTIYKLVTAGRIDLVTASNTQALSLSGCHAKARVLQVIEHDALAHSLATDILANVSADGSIIVGALAAVAA